MADQHDMGVRIAVVENEMKHAREEIKEVKEIVLEMRDSLPVSYPSIKDVQDLSSRIVRLENRNGLKSTITWVALVASVILNIIAVYIAFRGL